MKLTSSPALQRALKAQDEANGAINDAVCAMGVKLARDLSKRWPKRTVSFWSGNGAEGFDVSTRRKFHGARDYYSFSGLDGDESFSALHVKIPEVAAYVSFACDISQESGLNGFACDLVKFKNGVRC